MTEAINPSQENKTPSLENTVNRIVSPLSASTEGGLRLTPLNKELTIDQVKKATAFKVGDKETNVPDYLKENLQRILGLRPNTPISSQDQLKIVEHLLEEIAKNPIAVEKDIKSKLPDIGYKINIPEIIASLQVVGVEAAQQEYLSTQSTFTTKEVSAGWKTTDNTFGKGSRRKLYTEMSGFGDEVVLGGESMKGITKVGEKVVIEPTVEMDLRLAQVLFNTALPPEYSVKVAQLQQQVAAEKDPQLKDQKAHELTLLRQKLYKSVLVAFNTQTEKAGEIKAENNEKDEINSIADQIKKRMTEVKKGGLSLQHMDIQEANRASISETANYLGVSTEGQNLIDKGWENILMSVHAGEKMNVAVHRFLQDLAFENVSADNKNIFEKILANRLRTAMSISGIENYYKEYNVGIKPENISLSLFLSMGVKGTELLYRRTQGEEIIVKTPEPVKPELPEWLNPKIKLLKTEQPEQMADILKKLKEKSKDDESGIDEATAVAKPEIEEAIPIVQTASSEADSNKFNYRTLDLTFERHLPSNIPETEKSSVHEIGRNIVKAIVTETELGNLTENYRNVILNAAALNSANLLTPLIPGDERGKRLVTSKSQANKALAEKVLQAYTEAEPERIAHEGRKLSIEDFVEIKRTYDSLNYTPPTIESLLEGPLKGGAIPQQLLRGLVLQREFNRRFLDNSISLLSLPHEDRNFESLNLIAQMTALQIFKEIDLKTYHLTSHGPVPLTPNNTDLFLTWDRVKNTPAIEVVRFYNRPREPITEASSSAGPTIAVADQTEGETTGEEAVTYIPDETEEPYFDDQHAVRRETNRQRRAEREGKNKRERQKIRRPRRGPEEEVSPVNPPVVEATEEASAAVSAPSTERKLPDWLFMKEPESSAETNATVTTAEKRELPSWLTDEELIAKDRKIAEAQAAVATPTEAAEDIFAKLRRELDETDKKVASPDDGELPAFLRNRAQPSPEEHKETSAPAEAEAAVTIPSNEIKANETKQISDIEFIATDTNKGNLSLLDKSSADITLNQGLIQGWNESSTHIDINEGTVVGSQSSSFYVADDRGGEYTFSDSDALLFAGETFNKSKVDRPNAIFTLPSLPNAEDILTTDVPSFNAYYAGLGRMIYETRGTRYLFEEAVNDKQKAIAIFEIRETINEDGKKEHKLTFVDGRRVEDKDDLVERFMSKTNANLLQPELEVALNDLSAPKVEPSPAAKTEDKDKERLSLRQRLAGKLRLRFGSHDSEETPERKQLKKGIKSLDELAAVIDQNTEKFHLTKEQEDQLIEVDYPKHINDGYPIEVLGDVLISWTRLFEPQVENHEVIERKNAILHDLIDKVFGDNPPDHPAIVADLLVDLFKDDIISKRYKKVAEYIEKINKPGVKYEPNSSTKKELQALLSALDITSKYIPFRSSTPI